MIQFPTAQSTISSQITLKKVWEDYRQTRRLRETTVRNYDLRLTRCCSDWLDLPISQITRDMVQDRHASIKGEAMANSTMRTLKALYHTISIGVIASPLVGMVLYWVM